MNRKVVGEKIRQARSVMKDLTQEKLAELMNVDKQVIYRLENGLKNITVEELKKIAEITGKPIEFFLEEIKEEPEIKIATSRSNKIRDLRDYSDEEVAAIDELLELFKKNK
jgi:transcriptional regulator with XRE-family HTH domain